MIEHLQALKELKAQTVPLRYRKALDVAIVYLKKDCESYPVRNVDEYDVTWYACPTCGFPLLHSFKRTRNRKTYKVSKLDEAMVGYHFKERCHFCGQLIAWDSSKIVTRKEKENGRS